MKTEKLPEFLQNEQLRKLPFLIPQGYFEQLPEHIAERLTLEQSLEIEPDLQDAQLREWQVPEGYFDTLPGKIWSRIEQEVPEQETKVISLWGNRKVWSVAASVVILLGTGLFFFQNQNSNERNEAEQLALAPEEIERYLLETHWRVQPDVQVWLAGNDVQKPALEWIDDLDQETIEKQLENYEDELFTN